MLELLDATSWLDEPSWHPGHHLQSDSMSSTPTPDSQAVIPQPRRRRRPPKNVNGASLEEPTKQQQDQLLQTQKRRRLRQRKDTIRPPSSDYTQSLQGSPSRSEKRRRKRTRKHREEDQLYAVRDILDESETH